jgi:hypothetical protein
METNNDDKRDFYRIRDQVVIDYRLANGPELDDSAFPQRSPLLDMLSDLHLLDYESQHVLRQIAERDRTLAGYLKVINKRIDLVGKAIAMQLDESLGDSVMVTLSEGGMSFPATTALPVDQWLALRLVLLPSRLGMVVPARVVRCDEDTPGLWNIGVSFESMGEPQRQLLARHILQRQAQEIRAQKTFERTSP